MTVRHADAAPTTVREHARALAAKLYAMPEDEVRRFASELPSVTGVLHCRDVHFFGDRLVLKLAPDPDQSKECICIQPVTCPCTLAFCGGVHADDFQECFCFLRDTSAPYGEGQNEAEATLWRRLPPDERPHFAEVYASSGDGLWLIQERVHPMLGYHDLPATLKEAADRAGVGDLSQSNCGWRRDQPVILDYGISRVWQDITGETHLTLIAENNWRTVYLPEA